ncbi:MAG: cobalt-precorrin-5B (C(1))-methyltransferase [Aquificaceae bacterium]|nr:MAG: cobalt-precorrin-5B (C(1))-methyltransferase [Aquificaceae bacterium]
MREETAETKQPLRHGYTTGACATVTSLAAARLLFSLPATKQCSITLPKGQHVEFELQDCRLTAQGAMASTIKDAGDDPDVTHQALIISTVALIPEKTIRFYAGKGVGTVTRSGLSIPPHQPAINPIPRLMIQQHLEQLATAQGYEGGFAVTISIKNGEKLALKTMNPRLGIVGGLSILGTTGIVRPFSCSAYIASIHQGIEVAHANNIQHIAACTGSSSEAMILTHYDLPEMALIEMGDFVGAVLKHLKKVPIARLSVVGGFGKISKLAAGHLDLHSRKSTIDLVFLASVAKEQGADNELQQRIKQSNTSVEALTYCQQKNIKLADAICHLALKKIKNIVPQAVCCEVWAINRAGEAVGRAGQVM